MPGQYIDIGFVYPFTGNDDVKNELYNFILYLRNWTLTPTRIIASRDIDGKDYVDEAEWGALDFADMAHVAYICLAISNLHNVIITINSEFLGWLIKGIMISIEENTEKAKGYYCIDMGITGDQLIYGCDLMSPERYDKQINDKLNVTTNKLIDFMKDYYDYSKYCYAYCDAEAMIECTPDELLAKQNGVYSVEVIPIKDKIKTELVVRKNSWNIDGFSERFEPA